jgi:hypothetical protein
MLSQLARLTDTSQLRIEIQNVAGRKAHAAYRYKLRSIAGAPSSKLLEGFFDRTARRSIRDIGQEFQKRNATLCEATAMESVQRSWICAQRFAL